MFEIGRLLFTRAVGACTSINSGGLLGEYHFIEITPRDGAWLTSMTHANLGYGGRQLFTRAVGAERRRQRWITGIVPPHYKTPRDGAASLCFTQKPLLSVGGRQLLLKGEL